MEDLRACVLDIMWLWGKIQQLYMLSYMNIHTVHNNQVNGWYDVGGRIDTSADSEHVLLRMCDS